MKTVYWIIAVILAAAAIVLLILYGRPPSVSEATADFCADVNAYATALLELRAIDESSTVEELQSAGQAVSDSLQAVQASAQELTDARIAALESSQEELQATITSIPSYATLVQAGAEIRLATLNALADTVEVMSTSCSLDLVQGEATFDFDQR
jgi:hypothetical protein